MIRQVRLGSDESASRTGEEIACWLEQTSLGRDWLQMKREILRHKWFESERAGHDVGWNRAFVSWMVRHRRTFAGCGR